MINRLFAFIALVSFTTIVSAANYPMKPDRRLTPGSLCDQPIEYRYQERIAYCGRDVETALKNDVFVAYRKLGFVLSSSTRADYKIDHYIPLCLGGSNYQNNLWPQHISIYSITDPLEAKVCEKLAQKKLKHAEALKILMAVKNDLSLATVAMRKLQAL